MPCARKWSGHTRLDSLCIYTAEDLEFLDTPVHNYTSSHGDHAQIQDYNYGTHFECMTNFFKGYEFCMLLTN